MHVPADLIFVDVRHRTIKALGAATGAEMVGAGVDLVGAEVFTCNAANIGAQF